MMKPIGKITLLECRSAVLAAHFNEEYGRLRKFLFKLWNFRRCAPKGKVRVVFVNHETGRETKKFDCSTVDLALESISRQFNATNRRGHFLICDEHAHILQTRCC